MNEKLLGRKQACHIKNKTLKFAQTDGKKTTTGQSGQLRP
jgi:hypothetical protein